MSRRLEILREQIAKKKRAMASAKTPGAADFEKRRFDNVAPADEMKVKQDLTKRAVPTDLVGG